MIKSFNKFMAVASLTAMLVVPVSVNAQGLNTRTVQATKSATVKMDVNADRVAKLQTKALMEIDRRLSSLNVLLPMLSGMTMVAVEDKNTMIAEVTQAASDLTKLRSQISTTTDIASLRPLVKSITDSYRVFAFQIPRMHLLLVGDKQLTRIGSLMDIVTKIQADTIGVDASAANMVTLVKSLDNAQIQLVAMKDKTSKMMTSLVGLKLSGYPGNKSTLQSARQLFGTNNSDLMKLIGGLKGNLGVLREKGEKDASGSAMMPTKKELPASRSGMVRK